ncbi:MAG: hypothetical protein JNK65_07520 [Deltaproteobacteria bacterium]|nr:hypothetical protein [Deltaproteobacteria bacterium]
MIRCKIKTVYQISVDTSYRDYVEESYEAFHQLAQHIYCNRPFLTDSEDISQIQDLYYLIQQGILRIHEEQSHDGSKHLVLEVNEQSLPQKTAISFFKGAKAGGR